TRRVHLDQPSRTHLPRRPQTIGLIHDTTRTTPATPATPATADTRDPGLTGDPNIDDPPPF
ncbi:MAG: hypothetical protein ACRDVZ_04520, partial [Jiangellaceae bacterium]